ncbi:uncharacterized protein KY384_008991 [Bacidia gigantensis]|uniref:uncharacterized protein n=1 Tax=Bacidia gigantensis TaxID=2732470 RepID=UPI001D054DAA|nr:uncharacterized protein KY384_008991 [Bacidia gigantensis]KAG8525347.1 hypothetical protein KY384_008991 [Bacidia gigantensis]
MPNFITVATCSLNQWALDWEGNLSRIISSIEQAKAEGATLRVGPELEITGYACYDHFLEADTFLHSWEMLSKILCDPVSRDILLDIGMPVSHRNVSYNSRIICFNGQILLIRPKLYLAESGNYREFRFFAPWGRPGHHEEYILPRMIQNLTGQKKTTIGDAVIGCKDTVVGCETCEELFTPCAPCSPMGLDGVEIFTNSSGSHHELRKLKTRFDLINEATRKAGGIYLYSNSKGCSGDRLYYDGSAMIFMNGNLLQQGSQFSLDDVEVTTATCDLEEVRSFRRTPTWSQQAPQRQYTRIEVDFALSVQGSCLETNLLPTKPREPYFHIPEEEISQGPACYLWDYLRRSRQAGFFLPLSGGIDSASTALIVFSMCRLVAKAIENKNAQVIADLRMICKDDEWLPDSPEEICNRLFHTCYMGTEKNSSKETRQRAKDLAKRLSSYHTDVNIDSIVTAVLGVFTAVTRFTPHYTSQGGTVAEGPDLNPIGGISKLDLRLFIAWAKEKFDLPIMSEFLTALPTAELVPFSDSYSQNDEEEMGLTYKELSVLGRLRKIHKLGPFGAWEKLVYEWQDIMTPQEIYEKVKTFFHYYGINRHKMVTVTPALHLENYSPDDNRFDERPFLYPYLSWPYKKIEMALKNYNMKIAEKEY